jgi:hypothetical protein
MSLNQVSVKAGQNPQNPLLVKSKGIALMWFIGLGMLGLVLL